MKKLLPVLVWMIISSPLIAQKKNKSNAETPVKWEVANPGKDFKYKTHAFSTDEGTWMNLDVSPDGKTILFDLLGDIYSLPITGGKAKVLRDGIPFEVQPRFSPDGKKISFTSDAGGGDNIWIMNADGSNPKQITEESFRLLNNAVWSADGDYLLARKHFSSGRSLGAGEIWQYHRTGGVGIQLVSKKNEQQDINEPFVSPDGRYVYYSEDMYPGGYFQYNKDPNSQIYAIKRYDFETGETETVTGGPGGAARPTISRDGKKLAFIKRVRTKSVLYIHDLETGKEWPIYDKLDKDQQEAWAIFGVYPNFTWMPNDEEIIFWSAGRINKIDINALKVSNIPFTADVKIDLAKPVHFNNRLESENFTPKMIRNAITSPDGNVLVFNSLGQLYKKNLPSGVPQRITKDLDFEFEPSFSANGEEIIYITWNDSEKGGIYKLNLNTGLSQKITKEKGIYRSPSYSPDGKQIVFIKASGNSDQGFTNTKNPGVFIMDADGKNEKFLTKHGDYPMFSVDGKRIFLQTGGTYFGDLEKKLISVNLDGKDEKTHIMSKYANRLVPSPDNKWIAFTNLHKVFVAPLVMNGQTINMDNNSKSVPVSELAKDAGINIHWSNKSDKVMWTLGDQYFGKELKDSFTFLKDSPEKLSTEELKGIAIGLEAPMHKPSGRIAFTNARIITMDNDKVIERGSIIINENKIEAVGEFNSVSIPSGTKTYDLQGKTIMPGMVDAHAHIGAFRYGLPSQQYWPFMANLAFGVTTSHDPSANTETVFTLSELQKSGKLIGPRLFSTGFILYGAEGDFKAVINNLEDARSSIRRTKAFGAKSVKSYNQPRREQRQQVLQAAREMGINVVPEGGSTFNHNITMVIDGHTGIEHNIPVAPVYKDIHEIWGKSGVGYTPTLIVNYGGMNGEVYHYEKDNVWENKRLLTFTPREIVDSRSRHRIKVPNEEYENGHILVSKTVNSLSDAGVKINMGAHGQLQGLGAHWETWMLEQGGMSNLEALKAATINSAEYLGLGEDIGSLRKGKFADLVILEKNPLQEIRNTESIEMVMINGRLFDAHTMNEIGNHPKERLPFYWEMDGYNASFPWHQDTNGFMDGGCTCH